MKVAYYARCRPSGRASPTTARCSCRRSRERVDVEVVRARAEARRRAAPTSRSTTSATTPTRTAGSSTRCAGGPASSSCTSFVLHHLVAGLTIGRRDGARLPRRDGARGRRRRPPARATACSTSASRRSGRAAPEDFPLAGEVLDLATGLIVHSRYVEERARAAGLRGPDLADPASRPGRVPAVEPADVRGRPALRLLRQREREQARSRSCSRRSRALRRDAPGGAAAARRRRPRRASTSTGACSGSASPARASSGEDYVPEERLWALMAACDACVNLRAPTMGETSGSVDPRSSRSASRVVVSDVGWFAELPDEVALKVPVDEHEAETLARGARAARRATRTCARAMGAAARELVRAGARPRARRRALRRRARAGGGRRGRRGRGAAARSPPPRPRSASSPARPRPRSSRGGWPRSSLVR